MMGDVIYRTAVDGEEMPEVYEGDRPYIFVSYAHADRGTVLPIIRVLSDEGYRVWYDDGIQLGKDYPTYIADHVVGCSLVILFVSRVSLKSSWCDNEVHYALDQGKQVLPIYLQDVELTRGLAIRMSRVQSLSFWEYDSDEAFYEKLFETRALDRCLTDEGKERRQSKNLLFQKARRLLGAGECGREDFEGVLEDLSTLSGSLPRRDEEVEQLIHELKKSLEPPKKPRLSIVAKAVIVVVSVAVIIAVIARYASQPISGLEKNTQQPNDTVAAEDAGVDAHDNDGARYDALVDGVQPKSALNDYSWDELKQLATAIAKASDGEWLEIAKVYNLAGNDGKLQGDEKTLVLNDDTKTSIRILGFRHDELANGGKAGISFEFADIPVAHCMNEKDTNEGGWGESDMREWLDSEFLSSLPPELQSRIETVKKQTNNAGQVETEDDTSLVTPMNDRLWLLSVSEVYGHIDGIWSSATYDVEGTQYKLYADKGVTAKTYDFSKKDGALSWWWLRSPCAYDVDLFRLVNRDGGWYRDNAGNEWGVSPGFCF